MQPTRAPFLLVLAAFGILSAPAEAADLPARPREINVTTDSAPGWVPSEDQERAALKTANDFLAALDSGRAADAYAMLSDGNRRDQSLADYTERLARFNALAGAVKERRIIKATWTKDSPRAPEPGAYIAIDLLSRFEQIDRHCGYLVLRQAPAGGAFRVMRTQDAFIDNASATKIAAGNKPTGLDALWRQLSASCPNYPQPPLPEQPGSTIGYSSAEAALAALRSQSGVEMSTQNGWTIATDGPGKTVWSFPPVGHPAYPSAVKRQVVQKGREVHLETRVLCRAEKAVCDDLVRAFEALNNAAIGGRRR